MSITIEGQLEIDHVRGVIYFHGESGRTIMRIGGLPEIPGDTEHIDLLWGKKPAYLYDRGGDGA
jgi:hypothetical protein